MIVNENPLFLRRRLFCEGNKEQPYPFEADS